MKEIIVGENEERVFDFKHEQDSQIVIMLSGVGARVTVNETFMTNQDVKSDLKIVHAASKTFSRVNTVGVVKKGILNTANCTVTIPDGSVGCDTFVKQKFVLLDKLSRAQTFPGLEIKPSKVKAGHSSSIAPISLEQIFYLMSKGMSKREAEILIIQGLMGVSEDALKIFLGGIK